jgi:hypothetical protein
VDRAHKFYLRQIEKFFFLFLFLFLFIINLFIYIFVLDVTLFFSHLLLPNPYGKYSLEERKAIFNTEGSYDLRSLVMKEGIRNGMMEVFVLFFFFYLIIIYYY